MSIAYSGNYIDSMFDNRKRYRTHFQKGVPLSCNELDEIQEVSDSFIKQLITANFPRGSSTNNGFKVIESATDNNNNFTIQGGDGSVDGAGVLFVDGYILFLRDDIEYTEQGYDTGLTPLVDDGYTKSFDVAPALNPPVLGTRIDEVYVDFYFAEVSATGTGVGTEPPEYKDTDLIVPGIGFSTANRLRMVQDIRVIQGGTTPADGDDSNGIYHRYIKIATIERDTGSPITQSMITDERILVNSISSYALGETQTDLILSDGSSIGDDTHRISSIFMASDVNFTSDLTLISQVGVTTNERVRFTTDGLVGVGTTDPQTGIHIADSDIRIQNTSPKIDFYANTNYQGYIGNTGALGIDIFAEGAGKIRMHTNGDERVGISSNGYVGIGTEDPQRLLHIQGDCYVSDDLIIAGTSDFGDTNIDGKLTIEQNINDNCIDINQTNAVSTAPVISISNSGLGPSFVVDNGNVGIGTTIPAARIQVMDPGTGKYTARFGNAAISQFGSVDVIANSGFNALQVWDDGNLTTPRFIVKRSGKVGISTTDPSKLLTVRHGSNDGIRLEYASGNENLLIDSSSIQAYDSATPSILKLNYLGGSVGIGTTDPQFVLHVEGQAFFNTIGGKGIKLIGDNVNIDRVNSLGTTLILEPIDDDSTGIQNAYISLDTTLGDVQLYTGNSNILISSEDSNDNVVINATTIELNGNVGIGTTDPQFTLHVEGNSFFRSGGSGVKITGNSATIDEIYGLGTTLVLGPLDDGSIGTTEIQLLTSGSYVTMNSDGVSNTVTVTTDTIILNGSVGIGTTDPQFVLHVEGQAFFNTIGGKGIKLIGDNVNIDRVNSLGTTLVLEPLDTGSVGEFEIQLNAGSSHVNIVDNAVDDNVTISSTKVALNGNVELDSHLGIGTDPEIFSTLDIKPSATWTDRGIHFVSDDEVSIGIGTSVAGAVNAGSLALCGGRFPSGSYGSYITLHGNDSSSGYIYVGTGSSGSMYVDTELTVTGKTWLYDEVGIGTEPANFSMLDITPSGDEGIHFIKDGLVSIGVGTSAAGAVNAGILALGGGRYPYSSWGAFITLHGNDSVTPGDIYVGTGTSGSVEVTGDTYFQDNVGIGTDPYVEQLRVVSVDAVTPMAVWRQTSVGGDIIRFLSDVGTGGSTVAKIDYTGQIFSDAGTTISSPADFAEWTKVKGDYKEYEVGTIVQQSITDDMEVEIARDIDKVYGVVTDRATFCGGLTSILDADEVKKDSKELNILDFETKYNAKRIAMTGHVVCKVVGNVSRGDRLVLSSINGVARSAITIEDRINSFAIARQNYNSDQIGFIEVRL